MKEKLFKDQKITLMGLGLLGRGVGDAIFLAEQGADLIVTDIKTEAELKDSVQKLSKYKNIKYSLGGHKMEDFANRDMILKSAGVPIDSPFIKHARENKIPVRMSAAILSGLTKATVVGVTGTRGKSTTTALIYDILKAYLGEKPNEVYMAGNMRNLANLPILDKAKEGDYIVMELDSWQLQGFYDDAISPNIAIFTTFLPDHMVYYGGDMDRYLDDKANIFLKQDMTDDLILGEAVADNILKKYVGRINSRIAIARRENLPKDLKVKIPGTHNLDNIACAVEATRIMGVSDEIIFDAVSRFDGVPGRLQFVKEYKGIKIYNDNNSTTPDSLGAGIEALGNGKNITLIMGGFDKGLDFTETIKHIEKNVKFISFIPGTGTDRVVDLLSSTGIPNMKAKDFDEAVMGAISNSKSGDVLLFSPGFSSFGLFNNEYERGDKFMEMIGKIQ